MSFKTEVLPDAPIIIHTHDAGTLTSEGVPEAMQELARLVGQQPQRIYLILDRSGVQMSMDDLIRIANSATRGPGAILHHPNVIESLIVVSNNFLKLGAMGMTSEAFGSARVRTFDHLDQALAYCHERIAETAQK